MATTIIICFLLPFLFLIYSAPAKCQMLVSCPSIQGEWRLLHESIGISAMHMQLLHNNKVVIFDRTDFGPSNLSLPGGRCRYDPTERVLQTDCTAHSILYDIGTNAFRPLMVQTNTWCSSGAVLSDGTLLQTGGFNDGDHVIRTLDPCVVDYCDWVEFPSALAQRRWYATDQILPDGRIIIIGGRAQFNYEFYPKHSRSSSSSTSFWLRFLRETRDANENNLYAFLHLLPDGNLFIFANTRCIVLDYKNNRVVREFPSIVGGESRNYPGSGSSVLLPINENGMIQAEIMVCGGAPSDAFPRARQGVFLRASSTCGRIILSDDDPRWSMENMPMPRVMGDMILLPSGDILIINGARSGAAGWENAKNPVKTPWIYRPYATEGNRFLVMEASPRPRLYHSTAILLIDGRVLVGGSNPHEGYNFTGVEFPTDLSLEAFHPPYLALRYDLLRPRIISAGENLGYQQSFSVTFTTIFFRRRMVSVRMIAPSFNTHSFSMNQRMVILNSVEFSYIDANIYNVTVVGPSKPDIAPPGYYMLFVVHAGIPSPGMWVKIQ